MTIAPTSRDLLLLNGPNLGTLGTREPGIYGTTTLAEVEESVAKLLARAGYGLRSEQHDGEGELIRALHKHRDTAAAIVNPGALMIAGWSLRDALADYPAPWAEVHISNVWARESFRHNSVVSPLAVGVIAGFGTHGYELAAEALLRRLETAAQGTAK
ncbi:type II 3-dehydroquinate dehydratase [Streptomyces rishiriensis]|uniref:3-dehydroquinate dehydratase n=1 Tax=Streptomyces rishiriensis TaxID=68264 RepID=A0ABU0NHL9_STRRH|nr:type II 3-dehydroquinate dehydratase [Streptomyces rishiriensis]MDQ0578600.1 5-deoxy-5-amino-3-dehydroquinate dehydratase [Streptomyces rishiriensis]